jgi:hypothetical protein
MANTWSNQELTRVMIRLVGKVPRGPIKGCHVAPHYWLLVICKFLCVARIRTLDLPSGVRTGRAGLATRPAGSSCYMNGNKYI